MPVPHVCRLDVHEDVSTISLNAKELDVKAAFVATGTEIIRATSAIDAEKEVLTLTLDKQVKAGTKVTLDIEYSGSINNKMAGFYRSSYVDKATGETM